jgi:hypothetical protein
MLPGIFIEVLYILAGPWIDTQKENKHIFELYKYLVDESEPEEHKHTN